ncbi:MAG TPA: hypothetical protein DCF62_08510 [Porticoccaceae bacterium]|nr:hypothetical protein [Porticoccaceae bacterium]
MSPPQSPSDQGTGEIPPSVLADLVHAVRSEITLTQALLDIIAKEHQAIAATNLNALLLLIDKKKTIASSLTEAGAQRDKCIQALGYEATQQGITQLLGNHPESDFAAGWQTLHSVASQCQEQNRLLGIAISKFLLATNQSIDILQGGYQLTQNTYGPKGHVSRGAESSTIAKI